MSKCSNNHQVVKDTIIMIISFEKTSSLFRGLSYLLPYFILLMTLAQEVLFTAIRQIIKMLISQIKQTAYS